LNALLSILAWLLQTLLPALLKAAPDTAEDGEGPTKEDADFWRKVKADGW
jgi:hypothetical protein